MTGIPDDRLRQILAHAYGRNGKVTALGPSFRPATATDKLIYGHPDLGTWCGPFGEYTPAEDELLISVAEASQLIATKLLAELVGNAFTTTARGRDHWRHLGSPS